MKKLTIVFRWTRAIINATDAGRCILHPNEITPSFDCFRFLNISQRHIYRYDKCDYTSTLKKITKVFSRVVNFSTKPGAPRKPVSESKENPKDEQFLFERSEFIASGFSIGERTHSQKERLLGVHFFGTFFVHAKKVHIKKHIKIMN